MLKSADNDHILSITLNKMRQECKPMVNLNNLGAFTRFNAIEVLLKKSKIVYNK